MNLLIKQNLTVEQRLQKAVSDIMMNDKYIALAGLLAIGTRSVRDDIPTANTNGRDENYGRVFCDSLNDAELRFLVLHENYHKAPTTQSNRQHVEARAMHGSRVWQAERCFLLALFLLEALEGLSLPLHVG